MLKSNERFINHRFDTPGIIPTIPASYDHTDNTWLATDIYVGEFAMNINDNKVWWRSEDGIHLLYQSGQTTDFVDLIDGPGSFLGNSNKFIRVNSASTQLEYTSISFPTTLTNLTDCPNTYFGKEGYNLTVNSAATALELTQNISTFIGLTDTPISYSVYSGYTLRVNNLSTGLEFYNLDNLVNKTDNQTISGEKIFNDNLYLNSSLFIGANEINNINIDGTLTIVSNTEVASSQAIKTYIESIALSGISLTGVAYLDYDNHFTQTQWMDKAVVIKNTDYLFFGDPNNDGCFRIKNNVSGALQIDKKVSGIWVLCNTFDVI